MNLTAQHDPAIVFLLGYMASGKTTLGRALAKALDCRFIDLDEYIELTCGKTVSQIFEDNGESHFRVLETKALEHITRNIHDDSVIVACGGGTPCFADNMRIMNSAGLTVWLDAPADVIIRRLVADRSARPLVKKLSEGSELEKYVIENLERRSPHYSRASAKFDSSRLECEEEIADSVAKFIENFINNNPQQ